MHKLWRRVLLLLVLPGLPCYSESPAVQDAAPAPASLIAAGLQLYRTGKFDEALEKYTAGLKADPHSAEAYAGIARVYLKQQKVSEAHDIVKAGLQANANAVTLKTTLGEVYFREGNIPEAEQEFVQVISSGANDARAYLGEARIRNAVALYKSGKEMIDQAHALDPADPEIRKFWFLTLKRADYIHELEGYLSASTNDDPEERDWLTETLQLLKAEQEHPERKCKIVAKPASMSVNLLRLMWDPRRMRGYGLNVKLNGRNSHLLLDTGAGGVVIKRSIAEKANIEPIAHSTLRGIGDRSKPSAYMGYADSIRIADFELKDCLVRVSETRSVAGEDGIVGADVFSGYLVDLDLANDKLRLSPLPKRPEQKDVPPAQTTKQEHAAATGSKEPVAEDKEIDFHDRYVAPEMDNYTRVFKFGHMLLLPTRVGETPPKLFIIDTGAYSNGISSEAAREVTKVHADQRTILKGINGRVNDVFRGDKVTLQFSRYKYDNQDIIAFDTTKLSRNTGTEISGLLGFTTLRLLEMKIDYRDALVDFVYTRDGHTH